MSKTLMMWLIGLAIAVLLVGLLVLSGGDDDDTETVSGPDTAAETTPTPTPDAAVTGGGSSSDSDEGDAEAPDEPEPTVTPDPTATPEPEPTPTEEPEVLLVPQAGAWQVTNQPATFLCGGNAIEVPASIAEGAMIEVLDGGASLRGTDFSDDTEDISLIRTSASPTSASYAGEVNVETSDGNVNISFSMTFSSPTHFDGDLVGTVDGGGISCDINRGTTGDFSG